MMIVRQDQIEKYASKCDTDRAQPSEIRTAANGAA
jgi:hypothetical protein